jgi:natural product precursor
MTTKTNNMPGKALDKSEMKSIKGGQNRWGCYSTTTTFSRTGPAYYCRSNKLYYTACPTVTVCPLGCFTVYPC